MSEFFNPLPPIPLFFKSKKKYLRKLKNKKSFPIYYIENNVDTLFLSSYPIELFSHNTIFTLKKEPHLFHPTLFWLFFIKNKNDIYERYGLYITSFNNKYFTLKISVYTNTHDILELCVKNEKKIVVHSYLKDTLSHSFFIPLKERKYKIEMKFSNAITNVEFDFDFLQFTKNFKA